MEEEEVVIITMRVEDSTPVPNTFGETAISSCDKCGEDVYVTSTSAHAMARPHDLICNRCAVPLLEEISDQDRKKMKSADDRLDDFLQSNKDEIIEWGIRAWK